MRPIVSPARGGVNPWRKSLKTPGRFRPGVANGRGGSNRAEGLIGRPRRTSLDGKKIDFELRPCGILGAAVPAIARRHGHVMIHGHARANSLVRAQERHNLPEQCQPLPVGNTVCERWRMPRRRGALARHFADADLGQDPIKDVALSADDGDDQLPAFVGVPPGEGNRSLSVDQSSDVSSSDRRQSLLAAFVHPAQPLKESAPGRFRPGAVDGGGGGTADLPLPRQAGLCHHPGLSTGGGAYYPKHRRLES